MHSFFFKLACDYVIHLEINVSLLAYVTARNTISECLNGYCSQSVVHIVFINQQKQFDIPISGCNIRTHHMCCM